MEKDLRLRNHLLVRGNNSSRTHSLKIPITNRKNYGGQLTKEKIPKGDMSIEAITDAIHEYMYDKLNEPTEIEKKLTRGKNWKITKNKPIVSRKQNEWTAINADSIGPNSMNVLQEEKMQKMW